MAGRSVSTEECRNIRIPFPPHCSAAWARTTPPTNRDLLSIIEAWSVFIEYSMS